MILAMEEQARRTEARQGHAELGSFTAQGELNRLMQLTRELLCSLRAAEEHLPPAEPSKRQPDATVPASIRSPAIAMRPCRNRATVPRQSGTRWTARVGAQSAADTR
ncbi:hypothetical protein [Streptomyces sp. NPDC001307]|uniref:hypothetical protein n=1 Tax=Streptomyces sp. NPDC001307 TaxID=3364560 RepID=UPI0036B75507